MRPRLTWILKSYAELTTNELYKLLQQRQDVFILEQECKYPDLDDKDQFTLHLMAWIDDELVAYSRIFPPKTIFKDEASFGRVLINKRYRRLNYGKTLIQKIIDAIETKYDTSIIRIEAQYYLLDFYKSFGFRPYGETFLDAGIKHIMMIKE